MENKSFTFKLAFLAVLLFSISVPTLARVQRMIELNEAEKEPMVEKLEAYKKIIASAATREVGLLKILGGLQQQCKKSGHYCIRNEECCSKSCREDDDQEYYSGRGVCF